MSPGQPTQFQLVPTWLVVALTAILLLPGILWYGFSAEVNQRFWNDIFGRLGGPMAFRFEAP